MPETHITDNHSFSRNWEPNNGVERLVHANATKINKFKQLCNPSSDFCRPHAPGSPSTSEPDSQSTSLSPDQEQPLSVTSGSNATTNCVEQPASQDPEQRQRAQTWTKNAQSMSFRELVTTCPVPLKLMEKLQAWSPPAQKRQPVTMRAGKKRRKGDCMRSVSFLRDQKLTSQCAPAKRSAQDFTPTSRPTLISKNSTSKASTPALMPKLPKSTGKLKLQEHTTTELKTDACKGENYRQASTDRIILNNNNSEDSILIKVIVDKDGIVEDVVQEMNSHSPRSGHSATPAASPINESSHGKGNGDILPTLSHETVSQTFALIDLPTTPPQPGEVVDGPLHNPTTPIPKPVSESCGQKLLEILNKNDKSDPLLRLLDSPKLFNGQIWKFVNYTEQEIRSWEAETPISRKSMKSVHTNPASSRGETAEPLKGHVPPLTAHHSPRA